jgi:hypothetical protein
MTLERTSGPPIIRGRVWQHFSRGAQHDHEEKSSYARDFLS